MSNSTENSSFNLADYVDKDCNLSEALGVIFNFGGVDGAHHKDWVLDQVVRVLTGDKYEQFVKDYEAPIDDGEGGHDYYSYETGIAP